MKIPVSSNILYMKDNIIKSSFLLLMTVGVFSCSPTGKHPRKKLPDALDSDPVTPGWVNFTEGSLRKKLAEPSNEWLSLCPAATSIRNNNQDAGEKATCNIGETMVAGKSYYSVQMASGENDESIMDLIKMYRPFAGSVVDMLLQTGREGASIDLTSANDNNPEHADFVVKNSKGQSFYLTFTWDRSAAGRATMFMNELQQVKDVTLTRIDNNHPF